MMPCVIAVRAKHALSAVLWHLLGRKDYVRLGRFLWMQSRLDGVGGFDENGELLLQRGMAHYLDAAGHGGATVFDVGANVGDWTLNFVRELSQAGISKPKIALHLFEPAPASRRILTGQVEGTGAQVHIRDVALADRAGDASFNIFGETDGINSLKPPTGYEPTEVIQVALQTLDAYCEANGVEHIDFVKIDTEGNDVAVLRGATAMMKAGRIDFIQFEYNHRWVVFRYFLHDVFELAAPLGYSLGKVTPRGIEPYREWHHELESFRQGNYLLWRGELPPQIATIAWWNEG